MRNASKFVAVCVTGVFLITGNVEKIRAVNFNTEVPLAGITISLDKYYESKIDNTIANDNVYTDYVEVDNEPIVSDIASMSLEESDIVSITDEMEELSDELVKEQEEAIERNIAENDNKEETTESNISEYENIGLADVSSYLNIRDKASENGKIIGKLVKNAACRIISVEDGWARIKSGKVNGYVNVDFLITGEKAEKLAMKVGTRKATVLEMTSRIRREPTTDSKIITHVTIDEELVVLEELDQWIKVELDRDTGYIHKDLVKLSYELEKAVAVQEVVVSASTGVSSTRANMVAYAKQFLGNRYVWGGTSLTNGTDCSGFTMSIYKHFGYSINRTSREQPRNGTLIKASEARPGDLIFYGNGGYINHVAMYIGGGQVIHASNARSGIKISNLYYRTPIKAVRIIKD